MPRSSTSSPPGPGSSSPPSSASPCTGPWRAPSGSSSDGQLTPGIRRVTTHGRQNGKGRAGMRKWVVGLLVVAAVSAAGTATRAQATPQLTKVTLQLKWVPQEQFAGYDAAPDLRY